jgi:hypothetical protein
MLRTLQVRRFITASTTGGVAALNRRLIAKTPAGVFASGITVHLRDSNCIIAIEGEGTGDGV